MNFNVLRGRLFADFHYRVNYLVCDGRRSKLLFLSRSCRIPRAVVRSVIMTEKLSRKKETENASFINFLRHEKLNIIV